MSTPKITLSPELKRKLTVRAIFDEDSFCDGLDPHDLEQAGLTIWRVAVTDFKRRLLERLEELNNGEAYTSESYNYASGRTVALLQVRKIIEELCGE